MKRIGIDCRFASSHSGIGHYTREVVPGLLREMPSCHFLLFVDHYSQDWLHDLPDNVDIVKTPIRHYSIAEQLFFAFVLYRSSLDLYFAPHFNVPFFYRRPFVCVVHDLILHSYPNSVSFFTKCAYRFLMRSSLRRAQSIIAVSRHTFTEIETFYGNAISEKSTVVGEAASSVYSPKKGDLTRFGIQKDYFMYVGNAKEHKQVQLLIDAFHASGVPHQLVLVLSGKEIESLQLSDNTTILQSLSEEDLALLYSHALSYISASVYEGFGLGFVEARNCGCPVIGVSGSAVDEVIGSDGMLVEPSIESLSEAFKHPPTTTSVYNESWSNVAKKISAILHLWIA